jgi:NADH-quinone oxidoreductase subunit D/NADH-quinone oxidoreductase subunit C/D
MKGVGIISPENAISYGCTGPVARGSGVSSDVRKLYPYEIYDKLEFDEVLETGCDSFARYMVRIREMQQSIRIIEQLIDNIPEGDFQAKTKAVETPKVNSIQQKQHVASWVCTL